MPLGNPHTWEKVKAHGREEYRKLWRIPAPHCVKPHWKNANQIWKYCTTRIVDGKMVQETIYGITNLSKIEITAKKLMARIKGHWSVENPCHQVLDATFAEDFCRLRNSASRENHTKLRRLALIILQNVPGKNIPDKRRFLAVNKDYLLKLVGIPLQKSEIKE